MPKVVYRLEFDDKLYELLKSEEESLNWARHNCKVYKQKDFIVIQSISSDIKSMKASTDGIVKIIDIFYTIKKELSR